ncbi:hypothetical protein [Pontiella sulfatireligans]|uniref:Uncharacterized protein n=1 Tax=Pontiella sulfatireligans TaxID=2750658 RepID=A0A6C2UKX7_9BACT|nr:hypothetical protein [Pontiella sulfatireligans]VGO20880.1 hypothetical protein SCARR_02947 [Pontiella sulfatireligans]
MDNNKRQFDFWYAVNNTELITAPSSRLETFGDTVVNYYLVCELMDSVDQVRVREGHLKALKPAIITPQSLGQMDVGDLGEEAQQYAEWLAEHANELRILQYGFTLQKQELKEYVVTDHIDNVLDRVKSEVAAKDDPLSAILTGVDTPWEVCLMKLMVELVQNSARGNIQDLKQQSLSMKQTLADNINQAFLDASRDSGRINGLADMLKQNGLWEKYEDRFFALVKASGHQG